MSAEKAETAPEAAPDSVPLGESHFSGNLAGDRAPEEPVGELHEVFAPTFRNDEERKFYEAVRATEGVIDVKGNGAILKQILTPAPQFGEQCPNSEVQVTVQYTGRLVDGTVFDSSYKRGIPFQFNLGRAQVIRGWEEGIPSMRVGEKALFTIVSDYAYGSQGSPGGDPGIPPDATLQFEVQLIDFVELDHEYPDSVEDRIAAAKLRHEQGNVYFKEQRYTRAAAKYSKGRQLLENLVDPTPEQQKESDILTATFFANSALASMRLEHYLDCYNDATRGIGVIERAGLQAECKDLLVKCHVRAGKARLQKKYYQEALRLFTAALELQPDHKDAAQGKLRAEHKIRELDSARAGMYKRMANSMGHGEAPKSEAGEAGEAPAPEEAGKN